MSANGANGYGAKPMIFERPLAHAGDDGDVHELIRGLASDVKDQAVLIREMASTMKAYAFVAKTLTAQNAELANRVAALERERSK
jgi:hypothetical protein